jgi:hypothetical protein
MGGHQDVERGDDRSMNAEERCVGVFLPNEVDKRGDFRLTIDTSASLHSDGDRLPVD